VNCLTPHAPDRLPEEQKRRGWWGAGWFPRREASSPPTLRVPPRVQPSPTSSVQGNTAAAFPHLPSEISMLHQEGGGKRPPSSDQGTTEPPGRVGPPCGQSAAAAAFPKSCAAAGKVLRMRAACSGEQPPRRAKTRMVGADALKQPPGRSCDRAVAAGATCGAGGRFSYSIACATGAASATELQWRRKNIITPGSYRTNRYGPRRWGVGGVRER
jgi:hypothetical protein